MRGPRVFWVETTWLNCFPYRSQLCLYYSEGARVLIYTVSSLTVFASMKRCFNVFIALFYKQERTSSSKCGKPFVFPSL